MPWRDWQFWVVTLLALVGLWLLVRPFLPRRRGRGDAGCSSCGTGSAALKAKRKVHITVEKRRV